MVCTNCGTEASGRFCSNCGSALPVLVGEADPDTLVRDLLAAVAQAEEAAQELDEIEKAMIIDLRKIRRAIEGEMRWGGLIFNPGDIAKAAEKAFGNFSRNSTRASQLVGGTLAQAAALADAVEQMGVTTPEVKQGITRTMAFGTRGIAFHQMSAALTQWANEFIVALAYANSARPLRIMTPPLDWEEQG